MQQDKTYLEVLLHPSRSLPPTLKGCWRSQGSPSGRSLALKPQQQQRQQRYNGALETPAPTCDPKERALSLATPINFGSETVLREDPPNRSSVSFKHPFISSTLPVRACKFKSLVLRPFTLPLTSLENQLSLSPMMDIIRLQPKVSLSLLYLSRLRSVNSSIMSALMFDFGIRPF